MNQNIEIKILRQHWVIDNGEYDRADLCSHGKLFLRIGDEILSDENSKTWALSATGLYLLRTLKSDYTIKDFGNFLVPCCAHLIIPDDHINHVDIFGCSHGLDWNIRHEDGNVIYTSEKGSTGKVTFEEYKDMVLNFTDQLELFYGDPNEKIVPFDEMEQNGFKQFWLEWNELKNEWRTPKNKAFTRELFSVA